MNENNESVRKNMRKARRITWIGLWCNLVLCGLKFFGGVFGRSPVLIADGVHSLSDLSTDIAVIIGSRYWSAPADREHPHGHAKIETLITLFIGIALVLVGVELIQNAVLHLHAILKGEVSPEVPAFWTLFIAIASILSKEILFRWTAAVGVQIKSSGVIANAYHHRSDAISSIPPTLTIGLCLIFGNQFAFLDPVGSILVSCMILYSAWMIVKPTFSTLLDARVCKEKESQIHGILHSFDEVRDFHKLRTRSLGSNGIAVDVHIHVDAEMRVCESHSLSHCIKDRLLQDGPEVVEVAIHIEPYDDQTGVFRC